MRFVFVIFVISVVSCNGNDFSQLLEDFSPVEGEYQGTFGEFNLLEIPDFRYYKLIKRSYSFNEVIKRKDQIKIDSAFVKEFKHQLLEKYAGNSRFNRLIRKIIKKKVDLYTLEAFQKRIEKSWEEIDESYYEFVYDEGMEKNWFLFFAAGGESGWQKNAISSANAQGICQITEPTRKALCAGLADYPASEVVKSFKCSARIFQYKLKMAKGDWRLALVYYNGMLKKLRSKSFEVYLMKAENLYYKFKKKKKLEGLSDYEARQYGYVSESLHYVPKFVVFFEISRLFFASGFDQGVQFLAQN